MLIWSLKKEAVYFSLLFILVTTSMMIACLERREIDDLLYFRKHIYIIVVWHSLENMVPGTTEAYIWIFKNLFEWIDFIHKSVFKLCDISICHPLHFLNSFFLTYTNAHVYGLVVFICVCAGMYVYVCVHLIRNCTLLLFFSKFG